MTGGGASSVEVSEVAVSDTCALRVSCAAAATAHEMGSPAAAARTLSAHVPHVPLGGGVGGAATESSINGPGWSMRGRREPPDSYPDFADVRRSRAVSSEASGILGSPVGALSAFRRMSGSSVSGGASLAESLVHVPESGSQVCWTACLRSPVHVCAHVICVSIHMPMML